MSIHFAKLFPTTIAQGELPKAGTLNRTLEKEILEFQQQDKVGRSWSHENYRGGYTSYASLNDLHYRTPTFSRFAELMQPLAEKFARAQGWSLKGNILEMNSLWMNVMPRHTYHTLHLHPHSVISGAYYVKSPKGSVSLKLEDPRMGLYMNAPVREGKNSELYHRVDADAGTFVLFESWLRHEVPPNQSETPRISLSFNYSLASREE